LLTILARETRAAAFFILDTNHGSGWLVWWRGLGVNQVIFSKELLLCK